MAKQKYKANDHLVMITKSIQDGRWYVRSEKLGPRTARLLNQGKAKEFAIKSDVSIYVTADVLVELILSQINKPTPDGRAFVGQDISDYDFHK